MTRPAVAPRGRSTPEEPDKPWYDEFRDVDEFWVEYVVHRPDGSMLVWRVAKEPPLTADG